MRQKLLPFAAAALVAGTTAGADPFVDGVVRNLQNLGYTYIEIDRGRTQLRAEGVRGSEELTVVYDLATGRILRQETGLADSWYVGRDGLEIRTRDRDFTGSGGRDDFDDDDDDDNRSSSRSSSRDDFDDNDDDDDDDNRSSSRDDFDDDNDDDDDSSSSSGSSGSSGSDDNDDDNDDDD